MNLFQRMFMRLLLGKTYTARMGEEFNRAFETWINYYKGNSGSDYIGAVYNSIDTWGLYFAKAKFRLYKKSRQRTSEEIFEHPFLTLFKRPNSYNYYWEYMYKLAGFFGLFGDAYIVAIRNGQDIVGYQMMFPSFVERVHKNSLIDGYLYKDGTNEKFFPPEDVMDFRYPNPNSEYKGHSVISTIADQATVDKFQMLYAKQFFENGGFLGLAFSTKENMNKDAFERAEKMLAEKFGKNKTGKIFLSDNGLMPVKSAYGMKDADFTGIRNLTKNDIYEAWKVSKIHMGSSDALNRATAEASIFQFTTGVIDPLLDYVDAIMTRFVEDNWGEKYFVKHDTLAPKDVDAQLKYYKDMFSMGALTINEIREYEGENKYTYELADVPILNLGGTAVRLDNDKQIGVPDETEENKNQGQTRTQDEDSNGEEAGKEGGTGSKKNIYTLRKEMDSDFSYLKWKQFDNRINIIVRRFSRVFDDYIDAQRKRILDAVKDVYIVGEVFNLREENLILYQLLEIEVYEIMKAGYDYGNSMNDITGEFNRANFQSMFTKINENAIKLNQTTSEFIRNLYAPDLESFKNELNSFYDKSQFRFNATVGEVAVSSFNAGLHQNILDAGYLFKTWISKRDNRVRDKKDGENHWEMDSQTVEVNDFFYARARNGNYDRLMFPGDPNGSPENIINCRCTLIGTNTEN